jgi:hypothetical protein
MTETPFPEEPLHNIVWLEARSLHANAWNPNRVFQQELRLLERSILTTGWVQPIIVSSSGLIIDGFHRWRLAQDSAEILNRYLGLVPCVVRDIPDDDAMALTVRINRAKGTHSAVEMHRLVSELVNTYGWARERVGESIGANFQEVDLLLQEGVFAQREVSKWAYSPAWYPRDGELAAGDPSSAETYEQAKQELADRAAGRAGSEVE